MSTIESDILAITSARGGAGATTLAVHCAIALARQHQEVLLIECSDAPTGQLYFASTPVQQVQAAPFHTISEQLHCLHPEENLWYTSVSTGNFNEFFNRLNRQLTPGQWIIVNCPAVDNSHGRDMAAQASQWASQQLHMVAAETSHLLALTPQQVSQYEHILLSRIDPRRALSKDIDRVLTTVFEDRLVGRIHHDEYLAESLASHTNVFDFAPSSHAATQLKTLAEAVLSRAVPTSGQPVQQAKQQQNGPETMGQETMNGQNVAV